MANSVAQTIRDAEVDARSLSEFMYKPASFMVSRRLSPPIHTLQFYIEKMERLSDVVDIVNTAIDATVIAGNDIPASLVTLTPTIDGAAARTLASKLRDNPSLNDFGVVGDGVADDTEAVRAYHTYCNSKNIAADYSGVKSLALDSDARIIINTDVNFRGVPIRILNDKFPNGGTWETSTIDSAILYQIYDETCGLIETTGSLDVTKCQKGSFNPLANSAYTAEGFYHVKFHNTKKPDRYVAYTESGDLITVPYESTFHCIGGGLVSHPLAMDADGSDVTVIHRPNPKRGWLHLENPCLIMDGKFHRQVFMLVNRNKVKVSKFSINFEKNTTKPNVQQLITVYDASEFEFDGCSSQGMPRNSGDGTYIYYCYRAANTAVSNIQVLEGWGWHGQTLVNGAQIRDSTVLRYDIHDGVFNVNIDGVNFYNGSGVSFGAGGGYLYINNVTVRDSALLSTRSDYGGGWWTGNIHISNINVSGYEPLLEISMRNKPFEFKDYFLRFAENLSISNVTYLTERDLINPDITPELRATDNYMESRSLIYIPTSTSRYAMPYSITISNVVAVDKALSIATGYGRVYAESTEVAHTLTVKDVVCGSLYIEDKYTYSDLVKFIKLRVCIDNITTTHPMGVFFRYEGKAVNHLRISNCNDLKMPITLAEYSATQGGSIISINNCNISPWMVDGVQHTIERSPAGLSATRDPDDRWKFIPHKDHLMSFRDCTISGYIMASGISSMQGCIIKGATFPVLTDITEDSAFLGFRAKKFAEVWQAV